MPDLKEAYGLCAAVLKPQRQGTCGLYSFWFATLLLNSINPDRRPVVYPRKHEQRVADSTVQRGQEATSLRSFAKTELGSGQGEVLTLSEMVAIVNHFGWDWVAHVSGGDERRAFITECLVANRPVMFAYLTAGNPRRPATVAPPDRQCGPHWSLIIAEDADNYEFIDPNQPNTIKRELKQLVLESNAKVDDFVTEKTWVKPNVFWYNNNGAPLALTATKFAEWQQDYPGLVPARTYDLSRVQELNNLLVAIC